MSEVNRNWQSVRVMSPGDLHCAGYAKEASSVSQDRSITMSSAPYVVKFFC
jgi:hypothetical protein